MNLFVVFAFPSHNIMSFKKITVQSPVDFLLGCKDNGLDKCGSLLPPVVFCNKNR